MPQTLSKRVADRLATLRAARGLTLDQLASISGVSRAALSRMENAEVSPSADALSRIAKAHGMTLSRMVAAIEPGFAALIRRADQASVKVKQNGVQIRQVSPGAASLAGRVLEGKLPPGSRLDALPDAADGQEHHLVVLTGAMQVALEDGSHDLGPGDALRYRVDGPVRFETQPGQGAKYMLVIIAA